MAVAALLALAGCCDEAAQQACLQREAQRAQLVPVQQSPEAAAIDSPFRLEVRKSADIALEASVVGAGCGNGKGEGAEIKLAWKITKPGAVGVRVLVSQGNADGKLWMQGAAVDEGVTGPWINNGSRLVLEDQGNGRVLAEVAAMAQACAGSAVR